MKRKSGLSISRIVVPLIALLLIFAYAAGVIADGNAEEPTSLTETASAVEETEALDEWTCKVCSTVNNGGTKCTKCEASRPTLVLSIIALVVLAVVIAIGFIKKVNLGFLSIGAAFILALVAGIGPKYITKAFDADMFVTLVGVTFLFGMASQNGTLDLFSKKVVALVGRHTVLIPILMFFLSAFISAIGPGHIAAGILSWVSSTTGVVMPAMFKMLPNIMRNFGDSVNYMEMISAITATSFAAVISPLSTGGAIIMSSYSASKETTNAELNKIFKFLFLLSVGNVLLNVLLSWIGVFSLGGLF